MKRGTLAGEGKVFLPNTAMEISSLGAQCLETLRTLPWMWAGFVGDRGDLVEPRIGEGEPGYLPHGC